MLLVIAINQAIALVEEEKGAVGFAIGERTVVTRGAHQQCTPLHDALHRGLPGLRDGFGATTDAADSDANAAYTNDSGKQPMFNPAHFFGILMLI